MSIKQHRQLSPYAAVAIQLAAAIAPRVLERRVAAEFMRPRRLALAENLYPELPPADETVRVPTGDTWVAAWRWGAGPAVLLVHGWEDDHHCFDAMIGRLVASGQAVVAFDLPAHGESGGLRTALPAVANAVADVAELLGPVRAIVGHSFGGAAATLAVAAALEVERVVIMSSPVSVARVLDGVTARLGLSAERRQGIEDALVRRVGVPLELLELEPIAKRLDAPTLVVHSRDDRMVPFFAGVRLQRAWPGAKLCAVDGLGHRRILSDPAVMDRVANFVAAPAANARLQASA
jgi:pimeloyl-ACP methyl ester carboxylesterase